MNHIRAFYTLPETPESCPTFINLAGNFVLFPVIYFTNDSILVTTTVKGHTYTKLTTLRRESIYLEAIFVLLLIPSIILGSLIKIISYTSSEVRLQHRTFKQLHENTLKPKPA